MDNVINDRLELECKNLSNNLNMLFRKGYSLIAEPDVNDINVAVRGVHYISGGLVQVSDIEKLPDTLYGYYQYKESEKGRKVEQE